MSRPFASRNRRGGFTLVELLVVMSLMIVLATMAILIVPGLKDKQGVSRAADQFQGWLLIAKQRAIRDQAPRGIRLSEAVSGSGQFNVVQYIEQPDDFAPFGTLRVSPDANDTTPFISTMTLSTVPSPGFTIDAGLVSVGDWIQLTESNTRQTYRITGMNPASPANATSITVNSNVQSAENYRLLRSSEMPVPAVTAMSKFDFVNSSANKQFRFSRAARPMAGEVTQQLPASVAISATNIGTAANTDGSFDIVFMPSGQLQKGSQGRVVFRLDPVNTGGSSSLIVIYARTGAIASHPVSDGGDGLDFVRDGQDSGL